MKFGLKAPATMFVAGLALTAMAVGCSSEDNDTPAEQTSTVVDVASSDENFSTLVSALERTGLDAALSGEGPYTVFAPTNAAFERLPPGVLEQLDDDTLSQILLYHVVAGDVRAAQVVGLNAADTLAQQSLGIRADSAGVMLNSLTQVVATDVVADNGVIHVIDSVLLPPNLTFPGTLVDLAVAYPSLETLVGAVGTASLAEALAGDNNGQGLTLFAPGNLAFENLGVDLSSLTKEQLAEVLLYHVVGGTVDAATVITLSEAPTLQGSSITIDVTANAVMLNGDVGVIQTDITTSNGIAHIINGVLLPSE